MDRDDESRDMEAMIDSRIQRSLQSHKNDMLKEMGALFEKISESSNNSQLNKMTNIMTCDIPSFKRKSNEDQYKYNAKVSMKISEAEQLVETNQVQCKAKLVEGKCFLSCLRNVLLLIVPEYVHIQS